MLRSSLNAEECFQQITEQQLSLPGEKTMCFLMDFNGFAVAHPRFFPTSYKRLERQDDNFFGTLEPVIFQSMVSHKILVRVKKTARSWGLENYQWVVDLSALDSDICRIQQHAQEKDTNRIKKCTGKFDNRYDLPTHFSSSSLHLIISSSHRPVAVFCSHCSPDVFAVQVPHRIIHDLTHS